MVAKWTISEAAAARANGKKLKRSCKSDDVSSAVAATSTSAPEVASANPIMSSISTNPSSSDLASLIYSTFIIDHIKSNTNLKLIFTKNLFRKLFLFLTHFILENALSAQPHSYKSLDSVISSALRLLRF